MAHTTIRLGCTAALLLAACSSPGSSSRLRREINTQTWDDGGDRSRYAYLHVSDIFPTAVVRRAGPIRPLPSDPDPACGRYIVERPSITLDDFIAKESIDGMIIVHRGHIVYERYPRMRPGDRHLLFSVTKAFVGTAVAILEDRGEVSIQHPISDYIPQLAGTAWSRISVRDTLEMASGIEGAEAGGGALSDPRHKHYQMEASLGWLPLSPELPDVVRRGDTHALLASLSSVRPPGTRWEYASVNTAVLGWLLEERTGKPLAQVLSREIWSRMGAESDALMVVNQRGIAVAHGGLAMTLRDLARFGMLFVDGSAENGPISDRVLHRIATGGRPQLFDASNRPNWLDHVAYQWDGVTDKGDFFKGGFGGQLLYVSPRKGVVIAFFGTNQREEEEPKDLPCRQLVDDLF